MPAARHIQAVTFDVGGTLIAPEPSVGHVYAQVARNHGAPELDPDTVDRRFHAAWSEVQPFTHDRDAWERLVNRVFEGLLSGPPDASFFAELYETFATAAAWRIFPDVIPTLEALAGVGLDLGIISNWDDRLRPLLRDLRLDRYFNCIVISCEAGFAKPSPVIFEAALRQLGCPAGAVLHVGDGMREDFAGAISSGLEALHLRRDACSRDLQIQSLADIPARLSGPSPGPQPGRRARRQNFVVSDD